MKIPILHDLLGCSWSFHVATFKEMSITFIFSFMPLWLSAGLIYFRSGSPSVYNSIVSNISNGELLIYCNSIIAPIFYITLEESKDFRSFPSKIAHLLLFTVIMVISAFYFALQKNGVKLNSEYIIPFSLGALIISIMLRYSSVTINKWRRSPASIISNETASFLNQYQAHRGLK